MVPLICSFFSLCDQKRYFFSNLFGKVCTKCAHSISIYECIHESLFFISSVILWFQALGGGGGGGKVFLQNARGVKPCV